MSQGTSRAQVQLQLFLTRAIFNKLDARAGEESVSLSKRVDCATPKSMKPSPKRRSGATQTVGVSLDADTKRKLKALAEEKHHGNVSALITEMTEAAVRQAAFERAWRWYGGGEPSDATRARIDADLEEGWALARKAAGKKPRRKTAA